MDGDTIDWSIVHGIFELALYGGRIDNAQDGKVLEFYLKTYFRDKTFERR